MTFENSIATQPTTPAPNVVREFCAYLVVATTSAKPCRRKIVDCCQGVRISPYRYVVPALSMVSRSIDVDKSANSNCVNRRKICLTILQFLALAANLSWFLMKEEQDFLFFTPVTTDARFCHGELLKAHKLCTHPAIASCLASAAG